MTLSEQDKARIRAEEEFRQQVRNETATQTESYVDRRAKDEDAHAFGKAMAIPIFIVGIVLFGVIGAALRWIGDMFSWLMGR